MMTNLDGMRQDIAEVKRRVGDVDWAPQLQCVHLVVAHAEALIVAVEGYYEAFEAARRRMALLEAELISLRATQSA